MKVTIENETEHLNTVKNETVTVVEPTLAKDDRIFLLAIPDFLYKTLRANKISLRNIVSDSCGCNTVIKDKLRETFTNRDFSMLVAAQEILKETLKNTDGTLETEIDYSTYENTYNSDKSQDVIELSEILSNNNEINMSTTDNVTNRQDFTIEVCENIVFIILKSGFTNYILKNQLSFKNVFMEIMIEELFKYFGERRVINNWIF